MGTTRDQQIAQEDLDYLTQALFSAVADPERIIELTREQLLARLGWKARSSIGIVMNFQWTKPSISP